MFTILYIFSGCALLIARLILAYILLVAHGLPKLKDFKGTAGWMDSVGFKPGALFAVLAIGLEVFGAIALIFGFLTQIVAAAAVVQFVILSIWKWRTKKPLFGSLEIDLLMLALALVFLTMGPGNYALDNVFFGTGV